MKRVKVDLEIPDQLAARIDELIATGEFTDVDELARYALIEYIRRNSFDLMVQFPQRQKLNGDATTAGMNNEPKAALAGKPR